MILFYDIHLEIRYQTFLFLRRDKHLTKVLRKRETQSPLQMEKGWNGMEN